MENTIVNLGKKGFWYYVQLILITPFWAMRISPEKKSWKEFKNGLIIHKHEYDYENQRPGGTRYFNECTCKHTGCYYTTLVDTGVEI